MAADQEALRAYINKYYEDLLAGRGIPRRAHRDAGRPSIAYAGLPWSAASATRDLDKRGWAGAYYGRPNEVWIDAKYAAANSPAHQQVLLHELGHGRSDNRMGARQTYNEIRGGRFPDDHWSQDAEEDFAELYSEQAYPSLLVRSPSRDNPDSAPYGFKAAAGDYTSRQIRNLREAGILPSGRGVKKAPKWERKQAKSAGGGGPSGKRKGK